MRENFAVREPEIRVIAQWNQPWMGEPGVSQRRSKGYVSLQVELLKCLRDKRAARSVCAYLDVARRFNRRASSQRLSQGCREIDWLGDRRVGRRLGGSLELRQGRGLYRRGTAGGKESCDTGKQNGC